jgi:predicted SPOUT superfamily RNA methylase MTH1
VSAAKPWLHHPVASTPPHTNLTSPFTILAPLAVNNNSMSDNITGNKKSLNPSGKNARSNTPGGTKVSKGVAGTSDRGSSSSAADKNGKTQFKTTFFKRGSGGQIDRTGVERFGDHDKTSSTSSSSNNSNNKNGNGKRAAPLAPRNTAYSQPPSQTAFASANAPQNSGVDIPRLQTVSIALPSSMLEGYITKELKTFVVGNVARVLALYEVDEVVVYDDLTRLSDSKPSANDDSEGAKVEGAQVDGISADTNSNSSKNPLLFLSRILQYCETPPYLKRPLFPQHGDLSSSGVLQPLETRHHPKPGDTSSSYREGVVLNKWDSAGNSLANCGLKKDVQLDIKAPVNARCTVKITSFKELTGECVPPNEPRETTGQYTGYKVRVVGPSCEGGPLEGVLKGNADFKYDLTIGVGENGGKVFDHGNNGSKNGPVGKKMFGAFKGFDHMLIVLGNQHGLEQTLDATIASNIPGNEVGKMFDHYANFLPVRGCRGVRVEESLSVVLGAVWGDVMGEVKRTNAQAGPAGGQRRKVEEEKEDLAKGVFSDGEELSDESSDDEE